ncbi:MAG: metal-dependent transcriptional regulator [Bacteroidales bacterium]|nr:metal-dependent transcriptional regulator [Bacteroidales bacterium]
MSVSTDNFLKAVYQLHSDKHQKAVSARLVERLNVSGAAITDMAKHLAQKGLIEYEPYKELRLTNKGREKALAVVRKHRLWETFLVQVLQIPWEKVHGEAERLEHQTSDYLIDKIDEFLDYPKLDPHGDPIPDVKGEMDETINEMVLIAGKSDADFIITRVQHHDEDLMEFYNKHNIRPGKGLRVISKMDKFGFISVEMNGSTIALPEKIARSLYVKPIAKNP